MSRYEDYYEQFGLRFGNYVIRILTPQFISIVITSPHNRYYIQSNLWRCKLASQNFVAQGRLHSA